MTSRDLAPKGEDAWDQLCETCGQPLALISICERRLPQEAGYVERCSGCRRALWYRSRFVMR